MRQRLTEVLRRQNLCVSCAMRLGLVWSSSTHIGFISRRNRFYSSFLVPGLSSAQQDDGAAASELTSTSGGKVGGRIEGWSKPMFAVSRTTGTPADSGQHNALRRDRSDEQTLTTSEQRSTNDSGGNQSFSPPIFQGVSLYVAAEKNSSRAQPHHNKQTVYRPRSFIPVWKCFNCGHTCSTTSQMCSMCSSPRRTGDERRRDIQPARTERTADDYNTATERLPIRMVPYLRDDTMKRPKQFSNLGVDLAFKQREERFKEVTEQPRFVSFRRIRRQQMPPLQTDSLEGPHDSPPAGNGMPGWESSAAAFHVRETGGKGAPSESGQRDHTVDATPPSSTVVRYGQSNLSLERGQEDVVQDDQLSSKERKRQKRRIRRMVAEDDADPDVEFGNSKSFQRRYGHDDRDYGDFGEETRPNRRRKQNKGKGEEWQKSPRAENNAIPLTPIYLPEFISVGNLADALSVRRSHFLDKLKLLGFQDVSYDHVLDSDTSALVALEFNYDPMFDTGEDDLVAAPAPENILELPPRPPVVTIMGHVDHGKTTILDWLRKSSVAASEHGGITQHIGAFSVKMPSGKNITFLDTPGHSAFLDMRRRGATVTDIVVLVVAADDSVKPQTVEAIKHATEANVPIIVAINKIDKPDTKVERVKQDLAQHGVNVEDFGGDTQAICVSGKTGQGMLELEEATVALSEMLDHRADKEGNVEGWVIEAATKRGGRVATVLVRRGTLKPGQFVVAGTSWARIRTLKDNAGKQVNEALPGTAVEVDGWKEQPVAGREVLQAPTEQRAKEVVELRSEKESTRKMGDDMTAINEARRAEREKRLHDEEAGHGSKPLASEAVNSASSVESSQSGPVAVPFLIKADVSGSLEAIVNAVSGIGTNEVFATILRSGVGPVSEFDIELSATATAHILSFNVPIDPSMARMAESRGVRILDHRIIYELMDDVKSKLVERLPPVITQRVSGEAEISDIFDITVKGRKTTPIAGCKVLNGVISRSSKVRVLRHKEVIYDGNLSSLKNVKRDVNEMRKGAECGMAFDDWIDFKVGDHVQSYEEISEKRSL